MWHEAQLPPAEFDLAASHHNASKQILHYQLRSFLDFNLRRARSVLPVLVFTLAKNPERRFCTRREGL